MAGSEMTTGGNQTGLSLPIGITALHEAFDRGGIGNNYGRQPMADAEIPPSRQNVIAPGGLRVNQIDHAAVIDHADEDAFEAPPAECCTTNYRHQDERTAECHCLTSVVAPSSAD
jgi:hypothetical protein